MSPNGNDNWGWLKRLIMIAAEFLRKCIPKYEPEKWNDSNGIQNHNNCYNYACDIMTNTYAQPGRASGIHLNHMSCDEVRPAAVADGLAVTSCDEGCGCKECQHQVALVISPGFDFHWYRKDVNGKWSHKMGWLPASNVDNNGNIIDDPRSCARGSYTDFCCCFCVNKSIVHIN